jgi:flagellar basal-body rod modification protein FlgD
MTTAALNPNGAAAGNAFIQSLNSPTAATSANSASDMGDRFLKLLVTQMRNQDPLNPLDNAQVTTQMAQINTVSGIDKLNKSFEALSGKLEGIAGAGATLDKLNTTLGGLSGSLSGIAGQLTQSQALQGAGLVGRAVLLEGNALPVEAGQAVGAFDLAGPADRVVVEVLSPAGAVVDSVDLGAQSSGRNAFTWAPKEGMATEGLTFRVKATSGAASVAATPLTTDRVAAVSTGATGLVLELARRGSTPFSLVKAVA